MLPFLSEELSKDAPLRYVDWSSELQGWHLELLFEGFK
jgi:hypothetical protein